jgi:hypothetical protein
MVKMVPMIRASQRSGYRSPAVLDGTTRRVRKPRAEPGLLKIRLATFAATLDADWPGRLFAVYCPLAGLRLEHRWADWDRSPFTAQSTRHVSVYAKA